MIFALSSKETSFASHSVEEVELLPISDKIKSLGVLLDMYCHQRACNQETVPKQKVPSYGLGNSRPDDEK